MERQKGKGEHKIAKIGKLKTFIKRGAIAGAVAGFIIGCIFSILLLMVITMMYSGNIHEADFLAFLMVTVPVCLFCIAAWALIGAVISIIIYFMIDLMRRLIKRMRKTKKAK